VVATNGISGLLVYDRQLRVVPAILSASCYANQCYRAGTESGLLEDKGEEQQGVRRDPEVKMYWWRRGPACYVHHARVAPQLAILNLLAAI